jgi:iron complex outermembrane receptor protein
VAYGVSPRSDKNAPAGEWGEIMRRAILFSVSCATALLSGAAFAQTADADRSGVAIEEVVVTAQKREENLQDVAATVTAVSSNALQRQGVNDLAQIQKVAPEVTVQPGAFSNVAIRGIRTGAFAPTTEGSSAIHIDGVYLSRFTALNGLFFDLERVEVLAGPQGTLYGRNSAAGTINIISAKPKPEYGGRASLEYGSYNTIIANGAINIPVSDTLAVRAALFRSERDGFNDNGTDDVELTSARFSALWTPTEQDRILFTTDIQRQSGKGGGPNQIVEVLKQPTVVTCPLPGVCSPLVPAGGIAFAPAGTPGGVVVPIVLTNDRRDVKALYGEQDLARIDNQTSGAMLQWDHDFGFATLTSQAAFRDNTLQNRSGSTTGFLLDPRLITLGVGLRPSAGLTEGYFKWFSEEIRLTSNGDGPLRWLIGLYGFQERATDANAISYRVTFPNAPGQIGQAIFASPTAIQTNISNPKNNADAYAIFGQATYTPPALQNLHLTAGVRFNTEKKRSSGSEFLNGALVLNTVFNASKRFEKVTYKVNVAYDFTPQNMVYADHSTGFKSGGFAYGPTPSYEPETIKSYEIGTKNRFLDGRLQLNASAWHYDYANYVTTVQEFYFDTSFTPPRPAAYIDVTNAGSAKVDGQTVQVNWAFTDNDLFGLNVTHLKARFDKFDVSAGQALAFQLGLLPGTTAATYRSFFNYSDTPIGGAVDWALAATYDHTFRLASGTLDAQILVNYRGDFLSGNQTAVVNVNAYLPIDAVTTADLTLRYTPQDAKWNVTAYVRNLTDEKVVNTRGYSSNAAFRAVSDPATFYAYRTETYGPPRTFGVIFNAEF